MNSMLRIADVNMNRAREGLRVVEEAARFVLADAGLTASLKDLRHRISRLETAFPGGRAALVAARDSAHDIGARIHEPQLRRDLFDTVTANWKRVQEATRALEEAARGCDARLAHRIKEIRFEVYAREQEFMECLAAGRRRVSFAGVKLYMVVGSANTGGRPLTDVVAEAVRGGVGAVQLREKEAGASRIIALARDVSRICREAGALFIINDRADIAAAVDADGVHLGQEDLPVEAARRILGRSKLIGLSTRNVGQALDARARGADYIGVGPVFATPTKEGRPAAGLEFVRAVRDRVRIPFVAIGGIDLENCARVLRAGARRVAAVRALAGAPDVYRAADAFMRMINKYGEDSE
jgi:thiamine-phosphate pyrophosphorylase